MRTMNFPHDSGRDSRHRLYGILNECVLGPEPMRPYHQWEIPGTRFAVRSFGVRLSGEQVGTQILKEPYRQFVEVRVELVIPSMSADRVFDGNIDIHWRHPPPSRPYATIGAPSTEPVCSVSIYRIADTSRYHPTGVCQTYMEANEDLNREWAQTWKQNGCGAISRGGISK